MKRVQINLISQTCSDGAHAERVLARVRSELPPLLPPDYVVDAALCVRGGGRRLDPVWLPDTDPDDPDFDRLVDLGYDTMNRIRTEEALPPCSCGGGNVHTFECARVTAVLGE